MKKITVKSGRIALTGALFVSKPLLRLVNWPAIFVVNAGTRDDIEHYFPAWVVSRLPKNALFAIGFYRISWRCWALVVGSTASNEDLGDSREMMASIVDKVGHWKGDRIALTGILTAYAMKHGCWPASDKRFVLGSYGTPYLFRINLRELADRYGKSLVEQKPVGIVGYGYTGRRVAEYLRGLGYQVYGFDTCKERSDDQDFLGSDFKRIGECGLILLMTTSGDEGLETIAEHVVTGQVILADTHPKPSHEGWRQIVSKGVVAAECGALFRAGTFIPQLPRWGSKNTLGCSMQAIAEAATKTLAKTQDDFDALADEVGIDSTIEYPRIT